MVQGLSGERDDICGRNSKETELEVELEDVTEPLQSHNKTLMDEELLLWMSKESGFLRWNLLLVKML